jgi:hypothetical protein
MSSSYVYCALLYNNSDYSSSTNTDTNSNTKPDINSSSILLLPKDFYITEKELFDAIQA